MARSKSYRFEEFLTNWNDKLRSSKQTNITVRLIHEIERNKVILPVLKYVRGDIFSEQVSPASKILERTNTRLGF